MKQIGASNKEAKLKRSQKKLRRLLRLLRKQWDNMNAGKKWDVVKDVLIALIVVELSKSGELDEAEDEI